MAAIGRICLKDFLSKDKDGVFDRVVGVIYGAAIGNCLGFPVKGWMKDSIESKRVREMPMPEKKIRDINGDDWADAVDHMLLVMINLAKNNGNIEYKSLAFSLCRWRERGFPELGDKKGHAISQHLDDVLRNVDVTRDGFAEAVVESAKARRLIFGQQGKPHPNCALVRSAMCAFTKNWSRNSMMQTYITHSSSHCAFASWVLNYIIRCNTRKESIDFATLTTQVEKLISYYERKMVETYIEKYQKVVNADAAATDEKSPDVPPHIAKYIASLELDDSDTRTHVYKALGCAFYAQACAKISTGDIPNAFRRYMLYLANEGGDADVNCAVAGLIFGSLYGAAALPADWVSHFNAKNFLDEVLVYFLKSL